ncbi:PAS domain-containing protein [Flexibacterium corallicola]|uniref:PAS domain-containing protein n=1 Tax=Flexibacterium corallicola TaxID=3037259 RepID=UPI00286F9960|nr:PAS domain-containing protein [Pseudovibrio sp. M1P-2-3]
MKHGSTCQLFDYWNELRGQRKTPERGDIQPSAIKALLRDTFILEMRNADSYRYRLAGTRLCSLFCKELRGREFLNMWNGEDTHTISASLQSVTKKRVPAFLEITSKTDNGQIVNLEMLLLPLTVRGEGCTRILGCIIPIEQPGWLGAQPLVTNSISSMQLIKPETARVCIAQKQKTGKRLWRKNPPISTGQNPFPPSVGPIATNLKIKRVGHLHVINGGKS